MTLAYQDRTISGYLHREVNLIVLPIQVHWLLTKGFGQLPLGCIFCVSLHCRATNKIVDSQLLAFLILLQALMLRAHLVQKLTQGWQQVDRVVNLGWFFYGSLQPPIRKDKRPYVNTKMLSNITLVIIETLTPSFQNYNFVTAMNGRKRIMWYLTINPDKANQ